MCSSGTLWIGACSKTTYGVCDRESSRRRRHLRRLQDLLEPDAVKVARPVLRGPRRSNASGLPDQLFHTRPVASAVFDEPNLVSAAGLVPLMALARRAGLAEIAGQCHQRLSLIHI